MGPVRIEAMIVPAPPLTADETNGLRDRSVSENAPGERTLQPRDFEDAD